MVAAVQALTALREVHYHCNATLGAHQEKLSNFTVAVVFRMPAAALSQVTDIAGKKYL
jgi:hypothetical protein